MNVFLENQVRVWNIILSCMWTTKESLWKNPKLLLIGFMNMINMIGLSGYLSVLFYLLVTRKIELHYLFKIRKINPLFLSVLVYSSKDFCI